MTRAPTPNVATEPVRADRPSGGFRCVAKDRLIDQNWRETAMAGRNRTGRSGVPKGSKPTFNREIANGSRRPNSASAAFSWKPQSRHDTAPRERTLIVRSGLSSDVPVQEPPSGSKAKFRRRSRQAISCEFWRNGLPPIPASISITLCAFVDLAKMAASAARL
jgi:hypothetical protein